MNINSLGFDLGAVFCKLVAIEADGEVAFSRSQRHKGMPLRRLRDVLKDFTDEIGDCSAVTVGLTGRYAGLLEACEGVAVCDAIRSDIICVKQRFPQVRNILNIGGGSVTLIRLDDKGEFIDYSTNSMCAAGTGAFLDQQAERLGLSYEELKKFEFDGEPPPIATRCSVFAKTDLIHRQQEGYDKPALWAGLCKSLSRTCLNSVLRGQTLEGLTVLTGGVAMNGEVLKWLQQQYGGMMQTFPEAPQSCAIGAAMLARKEGAALRVADLIPAIEKAGSKKVEHQRREPLRLEKSSYPDFRVKRNYTDEMGNEVRISSWPEDQRAAQGFMGIDIGSTSTKLVVIDRDENVLADIYRTTDGDPINAVKKLFRALATLEKEADTQLEILGVATTGSGRKLIGQIFSADVIVNEISAHLRGALHVDPEVETIFEIGGQDSKYIRAQDGRIRDSNMNYVCAAGTGSFVEEQAKKLGFTLDEIGDVVMGVSPPATSDRCTVFMAQDVEYLIRLGFSREECIAAVLYSVVRNYLNKVVARRSISEKKIFFQGATARNKGLVAAFEILLNREIVVSPYCHVLGSFGAALIAKEKIESTGRETKFPGIGVADREVHIRTEHCDLCENKCKITYARIEGSEEEHSWGYLCGREPGETHARRRAEFEPMRERRRIFNRYSRPDSRIDGKTVVVPRALTTYSHLPFWSEFFAALGLNLRQTPPTDREIISLGGSVAAGEFCLPMKVAHGHVIKAVESEADFILLPHMICPHRNRNTTDSYFCPYVQGMPSVMKSALRAYHYELDRLLSPIIDFRKSDREAVDALMAALGPRLEVAHEQVADAYFAAQEKQGDFEEACSSAGRAVLEELERDEKPAIVIFGRPYNIHDAGSNLGLPQKIAELGIKVIPLDLLPVSLEDDLDPAFENMYWAYGQRILACADFVRAHDRLFAVYFTNFSCGPDSFLLTHMEQVMGEKPFLTVEIDEHGGDAGYMTRVEAYLDVVRAWGDTRLPSRPALPRLKAPDLDGRPILVPPMHDFGAKLFARAFRRAGYESEALPPETEDSFEQGRSLTRGSECLPAACTVGALVSTLKARRGDGDAVLFMPTASGPCRFGQYGLLHKTVLDRLGYSNVGILAPAGQNAYQGLKVALRTNLWKAIVVGDIIEKCACKVRPYEAAPGRTEKVLQDVVQEIGTAFEKGGSIEKALGEAVKELAGVRDDSVPQKPLVGVVGEIYVRSNRFCNDNVVRTIEALGGETWTAPVSEWVFYTSYLKRLILARKPWKLIKRALAWFNEQYQSKVERTYYAIAEELLGERHEPDMGDVIEAGQRYVPVEFQGEGILTLGRAYLFATRDNALLVVNAAPFTCMPGTVSAAILQQVQAETGIPMVSIFYDGKPGQNEKLAVYMRNLVPRLEQGWKQTTSAEQAHRQNE